MEKEGIFPAQLHNIPVIIACPLLLSCGVNFVFLYPQHLLEKTITKMTNLVPFGILPLAFYPWPFYLNAEILFSSRSSLMNLS